MRDRSRRDRRQRHRLAQLVPALSVAMPMLAAAIGAARARDGRRSAVTWTYNRLAKFPAGVHNLPPLPR